MLTSENRTGSTPQIHSIRLEYELIFDEDLLGIQLVNVHNNTVILPETQIEVSVSDFALDQCWFTWDNGSNFSFSPPWIITTPQTEGDHWLLIWVNNSLGYLGSKQYRFYINFPPLITIHSPSNNSVIIPMTNIEFHISDLTLSHVWYQWDSQEKTFLGAPYVVEAVNSTGPHVLIVTACDSWNLTTVHTFIFYILSPASIQTIQPLPTTAYSGERFIYAFSVTNTETIPLNLTVVVLNAADDVLRGNNTQFILNPGENQTIEVELHPKHASLHQLELLLLHEDLVYYHTILNYTVAPQWMSPRFLQPLMITLFLVILIGAVALFSFYQLRTYVMTQRQYWEYHDQLTHLIDQITVANLETMITHKKSQGEDPVSGIPGFPQHLQLSEPLDRVALERQFQVLRTKIETGDPRIRNQLVELLAQAETLLKESQDELGS